MSDQLTPCKTCDLPIKQGCHWNENLCLHALKNRVKALEQHERKAAFGFINNLCWQPNNKVNHLVAVIKFQYRKFDIAIQCANEQEAVKAAIELARAGRELLREAGL